MIDIIITAYNSHDTIEKTFLSLRLQSIKDKLKIYLIDDCSDKPYDYVIDEFRDLDITICRLEKNSGPGTARNKGLELSSSEFIMFLDSDDMFVNEYSIRSLLNEIKDCDIAIGILEEESEDGETWYISNSDRCLHAKLYKRSFIDKYNIKFPELNRHEDCSFHEQILFHNPSMILVNEYVYYYKYNKQSLTHKKQGYEEFKNYESLSKATMYAIEEALKTKGNIKIIEDVISTTLMFIYFDFQQYYKESYSSEIYEWVKPVVKFYLDNKKLLQKNRLEELYNNISSNYPNIPYISWYDFIDKASK